MKGLDWCGCGLHTLDGYSAMLKVDRDTYVTRYSRRDVLRILHLQASHLSTWERAGLITQHEQYSFEDLGQLRTLRDLRATRLSVRNISRSVAAMQRVSGLRNVLLESSAVRRGSRLIWRHAGSLMDPVTQQLAFDFETGPRETLRVRPGALDVARNTLNVQEIFLKAVRLEEKPETLPEAAALYESILRQDKSHAPASINLGTIRYNQGEFEVAERLYREATIADPEYALAFFDLGNVLDEMQRMDDAILAYRRAIALVPQYADAHYNLALAYERQGERRKALRHWLVYVRLDPVGPWASHAKGQARKILSGERLTIVSRRGRLVAAG
jgi:tetratricopeptide (TPR) repeat protein